MDERKRYKRGRSGSAFEMTGSRIANLANLSSQGRVLILTNNLTLRAVHPDDDLVGLLRSHNAEDPATTQSKAMDALIGTFSHLPLNRIQHYSKLGEYIRSLHVESKLVDVLIEVGGQIFGAHRIALACHSSYFADIFLKQRDDAPFPYQMNIAGISAISFQTFLRYVYTGEIIVSPETSTDIMLLAEKVHMPQIMQICAEYVQTMPLEQAMRTLITTSQQPTGKSRIFTYAYAMVRDNFCDLFDGEHFLQLSVDLLCKLLGDDDLYVTTEMDVLWAGLKWIAYNITDRQKYLVRVMEMVRFSQMSHKELFECFDVTDILRESVQCRHMVMYANWMITTDDIERDDPLMLPRHRPRTCLVTRYEPEQQETFQTASSVEVAISVKDEVQEPLFRRSPVEAADRRSPVEVAVRRSPVEVAVRRSPVEVAVRRSPAAEPALRRSPIVEQPVRKSSPVEVIFRRSPVEPAIRRSAGDQVARKPAVEVVVRGSPVELEYRRSPVQKQDVHVEISEPYQRAITTHGDILAVGGFRKNATGDKDVFVKDVGRYNTQQNQWQYYTGIPDGKQHQAVAMLNGKLYLVGGSYFKESMTYPIATETCFMFNPSDKSWTTTAPLNTPRMFHSVCALHGMLYVIGGQDDENRVLSSVEMYDPCIDTWTYVADTLEPRCGFGAAVCRGRIYVVGGFGEAENLYTNMPIISSFESYNPKTNVWKELSSLDKCRCLCNLVSVGVTLYLCGGAVRTSPEEDVVSTADIDVYDVKRNRWHGGISLRTARHNAGATVVGTKIYIIGGMSSETGRTLQSIECYDTKTETLDNTVQALPYPAKGLGCVVLASAY